MMKTLDNEQISQNIKAERTRAGFTQDEIARVLNVSRITYRKIEKIPKRYSFNQLEALAEAFGCDVTDFFMA